jgi:hypothetical protein
MRAAATRWGRPIRATWEFARARQRNRLQTETFTDLATLQSVSGVSVQPYSSQYELYPYLVTTSSPPHKSR